MGLTASGLVAGQGVSPWFVLKKVLIPTLDSIRMAVVLHHYVEDLCKKLHYEVNVKMGL